MASSIRSKRDDVAEQASTIAKDLQEVGHATRRMANDSVEALRETANQYLDEGRHRVRELSETMQHRVQDQPMTSVLVAAAVGFVLGRAVGPPVAARAARRSANLPKTGTPRKRPMIVTPDDANGHSAAWFPEPEARPPIPPPRRPASLTARTRPRLRTRWSRCLSRLPRCGRSRCIMSRLRPMQCGRPYGGRLLKAAAGLVAAIVGVTFVIACTLMLAEGLAELISLAAGGPPWVGNLALGGGVLGILGVAVAIYIRRQLRGCTRTNYSQI